MPILKTEDTGKMLEMGLCLAKKIPYDGPYRYPLDLPKRLQPRLEKVCAQFFPQTYRHTARRGARYDYTCVEDPSLHISAKSIKKTGGKVAPQVVGQASPQKFAECMGLPFTTVPDLKRQIQDNITVILPVLASHTFDCPNLFYNASTDTLQYILLTEQIPWSNYAYQWTKPAEEWNNSSTLKLTTPSGPVAILEVQFHTRSRTNMAVRWCYETLLTQFKDHFFIVDF